MTVPEKCQALLLSISAGQSARHFSDHAPVDGPNMLKLADLPRLLDEVQAIRAALARSRP